MIQAKCTTTAGIGCFKFEEGDRELFSLGEGMEEEEEEEAKKEYIYKISESRFGYIKRTWE